MRPKRLLAILGLSVPLFAAQGSSRSDTLLIREVRVFDGERVLEHRNVVVRNGKIVAVGEPGVEPKGAVIADGRGRTLLPGLLDCHVHVADDA